MNGWVRLSQTSNVLTIISPCNVFVSIGMKIFLQSEFVGTSDGLVEVLNPAEEDGDN